jgi:hypothetical protein
MTTKRIGTAVETNVALSIGARKTVQLGTAVEHNTAQPITAVVGSVAVLAFGYTTEALLPEGTVFWGDDDRSHDLIGSGTEILMLFLVVIACAGHYVTRVVARRP